VLLTFQRDVSVRVRCLKWGGGFGQTAAQRLVFSLVRTYLNELPLPVSDHQFASIHPPMLCT
jgi:hypothetical protein